MCIWVGDVGLRGQSAKYRKNSPTCQAVQPPTQPKRATISTFSALRRRSTLHLRFCLESCAANFVILPPVCNGPRKSANKKENAKKSKPADALGEAKSSDDLADGSQEPAT